MKNIENKTKAKITHIMADGTVKDSVRGVVVGYNQCPEFYELLIESRKERLMRERGEKYEQANE